MLALHVTALKPFMNALLAGDLFDTFLLEEASISTATTFTIDGRLNNDFFTSEEWAERGADFREFSAWQDMKGICFNLIKGKHTPLRFQFVFQLMPSYAASILEKGNSTVPTELIKALVLTIRFDGEKAVLYTGTSYTTFVPDKEPERLWDAAAKQYLYKKGIACEEL